MQSPPQVPKKKVYSCLDSLTNKELKNWNSNMESALPSIWSDTIYPDEPWTDPDYLKNSQTIHQRFMDLASRSTYEEEIPSTQKYEEVPNKLETENKWLLEQREFDLKTISQFLDDKVDDIEEIQTHKRKAEYLERDNKKLKWRLDIALKEIEILKSNNSSK